MSSSLENWLDFFSGNTSAGTVEDVKRVVVVGGGYIGADVAKRLEQDMAVHVTLIDRNPCLVHKVAGLRAAVDVAWIDAVKISRQMLLKRGSMVFGEVTQMNLEKQFVVLDSGDVVEYDYLVIATGACNRSPGEPPRKQNTLAEIENHYKHVAVEVMHSDHVVIIGGGAVGIEFAGEVKQIYPEKKVTLIHSGATLLDKTRINTGHTFKRMLREQLEGVGVEVLLNLKAEVDFGDFDESGLLVGSRTIRTSDGAELEADLVVICTGTVVNNDGIPKHLLDKSGRVVVRQTMQTEAYDNVFAAGDITDVDEEKMLAKGQFHPPVVVKNIASLVRGNAPRSSIGSSAGRYYNVLVVPVGKDSGSSSLFGCATLGAMPTAQLKSKRLFVDKFFPKYRATVPKLS